MIQAEKLETFKWNKFRPGYVSIKRNGIHAIFDPSLNEFYSRTPRKIYGLEHLKAKLKDIPFPVVGELVIPGEDFETASGKIRSHNSTPNAIFSIFNSIIPDTKFRDRYDQLLMLKQDKFFDLKYIKIEPMIYITQPSELDTFYRDAIKQDEEGICWISPNHIYQPGKRTWDWMKWVPLKSIEAKIIAILPGTKGKKYENSMGRMRCKASIKGKIIQFDVGIFKGQTDEWRKKIYDEAFNYIGDEVVIEFKAYSKYGIPVQPRFKAFRWDL